MSQILSIIHIVISILLIFVILLQQRGASLGSAFGGESTVYRGRRGVEKYLFYFTIILAVFYALIGILGLVIK